MSLPYVERSQGHAADRNSARYLHVGQTAKRRAVPNGSAGSKSRTTLKRGAIEREARRLSASRIVTVPQGRLAAKPPGSHIIHCVADIFGRPMGPAFDTNM